MTPGAVLNFFNKEIRGLHEAAYVLAFFTLGSQSFALLRDRLLAHTFGASETLDVFYAAFRIPDFLYALLASLVSLFVLIPFMEAAHKEGKEAVRSLLSTLFVFFSGALVIVSLVAGFFASDIALKLYPGFTESMHQDLVTLIHILLLQPLFLGISNLFASYVQIRGRFLLYALAPVLYNIGITFGIIALYPFMGISGLAWGVVFGALLHLGIQTPFIFSEGVAPRFKKPDWSVVRDVVRVSIPRTITLSSQQLVILILISLASFFTVGTVTSFSFAWNLQAVPLALIGASYSVAAFPKLARLFLEGHREEYRELILTAAKQILFWGLPAAALIIILRAQLVRTILGSGAFNWDATRLTGAFLATLVISLIAQGLVVLLVRACYAAGKTKVPLILSGISSSLIVVLAAGGMYAHTQYGFSLTLLEGPLDVLGVPGAEALIIAAAYSIGSVVNAVLLLIYFELTLHKMFLSLARPFFDAFASSFVAAFVAYGGLNIMASHVDLETGVGVLLQGLGAGSLGVIAWILTLVALGSTELVAAINALIHRYSKTRVSAARGSIEV